MRVIFSASLLACLVTCNTVYATKITPIIYALNTRGEIYANVNGTWSKGPGLPQFGSHTLPILTLAAGPSIDTPDGATQGQLYAIDNNHGTWSMPQVSVAQPFGMSTWKLMSDPKTISLADIAVGKDQLIGLIYKKDKALSFVWEKTNIATKGILDPLWKIDGTTDASSVAISQDFPATAFHVGYRYRFLIWERGYNKPFYAQLGKTGWIDLGQKFKKIYAGVQGSSIGIDDKGRMFSNQQVYGPQSSWTELLAPQLTSITTIEKSDDAGQWILTSGQEKLAFGLTTNAAGEVINEIMMSMQLNCQNKRNLAKRITKNALWRRVDITTQNRFGLGWELISLNSENEAPGLITALSIGSFDQTKEVEKAQREAAVKKAAQSTKAKKTAPVAKVKKVKVAKSPKTPYNRFALPPKAKTLQPAQSNIKPTQP